jgi:uncharacterized protein (TIGR03435 family)
MIPILSAIWAGTAPALGDHLWQSTLCLIVAGLLTLVLRKNHAQVRYSIWLVASVKFLIPFSLLIALGSYLAKPRAVRQVHTGFVIAVEQASQPFTPAVAEVASPVAHSATLPDLLHQLPAFLVAIWLCGFAVVILLWFVRWRRIRTIVRRAVPVRECRELMALRRVECWAGLRNPIELVSSAGALEPGVFGIFNPVLLWPKGISEHLNDAHLEAILAHEVWHVRRHDNLASAIHMVVEAIFWFHPLVWWLGSRLVEERERACDEEVLMLGSKPNIYAESILKTCEFCVESPLACVSGVTGGDLKKRIVRIMTECGANKLTLGRKLLLTALGVAVITVPIVLGLMNPPRTHAQDPAATSAPLPSFEVASIKPNRSGSNQVALMVSLQNYRFTATNVTLKMLIQNAYGIKSEAQLSGGPPWISSEKFDIEAKEDDAEVEALKKLSPDQRWEQIRLREQSLLADRFKLKVSHETMDLSGYSLVVARNGPKISSAAADGARPGSKAFPGEGIRILGRGHLVGQNADTNTLTDVLSMLLSRVVVDNTGLKDKYDFALQWTPDEGEADRIGGAPMWTGPPPSTALGPSIFTAIQEQLGLKLESRKVPMDVLVIDHIEKPSEN